MMKNFYTLIDILAVLPLAVRAATGGPLQNVKCPLPDRFCETALGHGALCTLHIGMCLESHCESTAESGLVPLLRLLKLIRRFGQIQLLAHVFSTTGQATGSRSS